MNSQNFKPTIFGRIAQCSVNHANLKIVSLRCHPFSRLKSKCIFNEIHYNTYLRRARRSRIRLVFAYATSKPTSHCRLHMHLAKFAFKLARRVPECVIRYYNSTTTLSISISAEKVDRLSRCSYRFSFDDDFIKARETFETQNSVDNSMKLMIT